MRTVVLRDDLLESLQADADRQKRSIDDLVNEAVAQYLYERQIEQIDAEQGAFEQLYGRLKKTHAGKWVAVHGGEVVDLDDDQARLHQRVRRAYGEATVLITQVRDDQVEELWIRTPATGRQG
jgi:predicted transcriptional regulator